MELLSPIGEYYIQLSYYSLIAIFQKTDFMHIQACREQYLFNNNIFLPILFPYQNLELLCPKMCNNNFENWSKITNKK